ncbi:MAG: hypothetical protein AAGF93_02175 [Cyanobacteria bacterium P01_H01_bin.105]
MTMVVLAFSRWAHYCDRGFRIAYPGWAIATGVQEENQSYHDNFDLPERRGFLDTIQTS